VSGRTVQLRGEAREVVLGEAQAVMAMAREGDYRDRLASLAAAADEGEVSGEDADTLEQLLELGLRSGRLRAVYGPGGERAAAGVYRRLPNGAAAARSAREVTEALRALAGGTLHSISVEEVTPGAFSLSIAAGDVEASVRLDRNGARLASIGV
jgi:hypothetical protein